MASLLAVLRFVPVFLVGVGLLKIVVGIVEVRLTGTSLALDVDTIVGARWLLFAAYLRAVEDALWTIGFAPVVWASTRYLERVGYA